MFRVLVSASPYSSRSSRLRRITCCYKRRCPANRLYSNKRRAERKETLHSSGERTAAHLPERWYLRSIRYRFILHRGGAHVVGCETAASGGRAVGGTAMKREAVMKADAAALEGGRLYWPAAVFQFLHELSARRTGEHTPTMRSNSKLQTTVLRRRVIDGGPRGNQVHRENVAPRC